MYTKTKKKKKDLKATASRAFFYILYSMEEEKNHIKYQYWQQ